MFRKFATVEWLVSHIFGTLGEAGRLQKIKIKAQGEQENATFLGKAERFGFLLPVKICLHKFNLVAHETKCSLWKTRGP